MLLLSQNIQTTQPSKKLSHCRLGPFEVVKHIGKQAYKLKLPSCYKSIYNVFYILLLELYWRQLGKDLEENALDIVNSKE